VPACRASVPPGDPRARGRAGNRAEPAGRAPSLRSSPQPASSLTPLRATLTDDLAPPRVSADGERRLGRRHPSSMTLRRYADEGGRLLRPVLGRLQSPGFSRVPVSVAVASIDEEVKCCWLAARGEAGRERRHAVGRRRDPGPSQAGSGRMQYTWPFPTTGVSAKRPAACFVDAPALEASAHGISHSPPAGHRPGSPPRDRGIPPSAPDGHLRVRLAGQQRVPGHAPFRVELARRRAPHRIALTEVAGAPRAPSPRNHPPRRAASAGSPRTGARSIPGAGRLSPAPTHREGPSPIGAIP
jgi:hypothetical protein